MLCQGLREVTAATDNEPQSRGLAFILGRSLDPTLHIIGQGWSWRVLGRSSVYFIYITNIKCTVCLWEVLLLLVLYTDIYKSNISKKTSTRYIKYQNTQRQTHTSQANAQISLPRYKKKKYQSQAIQWIYSKMLCICLACNINRHKAMSSSYTTKCVTKERFSWKCLHWAVPFSFSIFHGTQEY